MSAARFSARASLPPAEVFDARFRGLLDMTAEGVMVTDAEGRVLICNQACAEVLGHAVADIQGRDFRHLLSRQGTSDFDRLLADHAAIAASPRNASPREIEARRQDGGLISIGLSVRAVPTPKGWQFIGVMRAPRAPPRREPAPQDCAAGAPEPNAKLAHDLNQPLTAIMLYVQAMIRASEKQGDVLPELIRALIDKTAHEAERAGDIVQRMRQLANPIPDEARPSRADILQVMDEVLERVRRETPAGRRVECAMRETFEVVDPVRIERGLFILLRHVLDAVSGQPDPKVVLNARREQDTCIVTVEHNGAGLTPERLAALTAALAAPPSPDHAAPGTPRASGMHDRGGYFLVDSCDNGQRAILTLRLPVV